MSDEIAKRVYKDLGVKPVINAAGSLTMLGGSRLSPGVREAMEAANRYFVDMKTLLQESGSVIAKMLGCEAAMVTPGCASTLSLGAAACMTGNDIEKLEQLPDTTGLKGKFIVQSLQRYKYDRCLTIFGGRIEEVGNTQGTTAPQLHAAIDEETSAVLCVAPGDRQGVVPIEEVISIAGNKGVPVIVDAASEVYPHERMRRYTDMGADIVGIGAKYFGSCNSTGLMCGRKNLVDAAFLHSFISFETEGYRAVGRPMKVDRQEVIATVTALREWMEMDHEARFVEADRRTGLIREGLTQIPHIEVIPVKEERGLGNGLSIRVDEEGLGKTIAEIVEELHQGDPDIWVWYGKANLSVAVHSLTDEDAAIVRDRLREVLRSP